MQKSGTSALAFSLSQMPGVQIPKRKEVHYFDKDELDWTRPDVARLHSQFDWTVPGVIRGEATPIYTYWPNAIERMAAYNPDARIIVGLRQPSFRAHSQWRMEKKLGTEPLDFREAITVGRERVRTAPGGVHRSFSYVERGYYAGQIERLLQHFPRGQLHFLRTDRLWSEAAEVTAGVTGFLGLPMPEQIVRRYLVPYFDSRDVGELPQDRRAELDALYTEDIARTAGLTGLSLADWLDPQYTEPMGK